MKKQSTPASAEPIEEIVLSAKKPRASKSKAAESVKAAVEAPKAVAAAKAAPKPKKASAKATKPVAAAVEAPKTAAKAAAKPKKASAKATKPVAAAVEAPKTAAKATPKPKKAVTKAKPAVKAEASVEIEAPEAAPKAKKASAPRKKKAAEEAPVELEAVAAVEPAAAEDESEDDALELETLAEFITAEDETDVDDAAEIVDEADEEEEVGEAKEKAPAERPEPKLDRLQKILSMAGIASRRHAEEMILAGRVQVNGQVVTTLGAKADAERDHIRVDNKLLQGAERHRYFMLNKPKGYVTTVSDPEGRPTVMQLFDKTGERLYPVGRLDYLSEGLLLITNDGELANLLARAGSGVEKTYLVKVAGQPTEEELNTLRNGVAIERAEPGSPRVNTAPARVRQIREGDNPWFEVVLIEGRNRELRKMFVAIGHFVEKIRRIGYGPLVLDVEPGKFRELDGSEVEALRLTGEGRMKPRRIKTLSLLPKEAGHSVEHKKDGPTGKRAFSSTARSARPAPRDGAKPYRSSGPRTDDRRPGGFRPAPRTDRPRPEGGGEFKPRYGSKPSFDRKPSFGGKPGFDRPRPAAAGSDAGDRPARFDSRPGGFRPAPGGDRPRREGDFKPRYGSKPGFDRKPSFGGKPSFDRPRPAAAGSDAGDRPARFDSRPGGFRPAPGGDRPRREGDFKPRYGSKPGFDRKPSFGGKPSFDRKPNFDRPRPVHDEIDAPRRPVSIEPYTPPVGDDRPRRSYDRPQGARPAGARPSYGGSNSKPSYGGSNSRPSYGGSNSKPSYGGSDSKPSYGGSNSKPSYGGSNSRPSAPGGRKPSFGGARPGGSRPGGARPGGSRPGGSRPGGFKGRPGGGSRRP
ncbi:MAG: pseudouridine synthase [Terracidiphilus sp.]|nr:pseudouridine synthase [Terracidiphilus sp.]